MTSTRGGGASGQRICAGCRMTRLSRYNPDVLCASCMRAAQTPPDDTETADGASGRVPVWVWESPMLRTALGRMDLGAVIAIFRAAAGLSQLQLAQIVGCSQPTIGRIEAGERKTLYDIRELLRFADAIGMPRRTLLPLILGIRTPPATHRALLAQDLRPQRRTSRCRILRLAKSRSRHKLLAPMPATCGHARSSCIDTTRQREARGCACRRSGGGGTRAACSTRRITPTRPATS
jgi:transcriptional regulator with XRE-family HTH domain